MKIQTRCYRAGFPAGVYSQFQSSQPGIRWMFAVACTLLLLAVGATPAAASDPVGVYAFVDKVAFEPNENSPERIQVWGGFALATGRGETYTEAARGYMYFTAPPGKEALARKEWNDLKAVAGSGQIVAFGSRWRPIGTVRKADEKPAKPDPYPLEMGLVKITSSTEPDRRADYKPVKDLRTLHNKKPAAPVPATEPKTKS